LTRFAFIVHPLTPKHAAKKYPIAQYVPDPILEFYLARKSPVLMSKTSIIRSETGAETEGWYIACPLTPKQMMSLPLELVYKRIHQCTEMAADLGAELIGLGAFTSVVGDGGITIAKNARIAVTTGNSYTVATAIEGTLRAAALLDVDLKSSTLAVVGATGSIGKTCALMLGREFGKTVLVGRDLARTQAIADGIPGSVASIDMEDIKQADAVVTVTSSDAPVILPQHLKPGCIVCDVARPRDVSVRVAKERPDVLVIEGGVVALPGSPELGIDFGFPPKTAYACMSETIMLALEGRPESYTLGKDVSVAQVEEMLGLAKKHGFKLAGFRSFEKAVDEENINRARDARRSAGSPNIRVPSSGFAQS
jgi:predicted amino acid dehydrogenase